MAAITFNTPIGSKRLTDVERALSTRAHESVQTATTTASPDPTFAPLDSNVVSGSIPAFFIGRNADGFWVARERNGAIGGIFLLKRSALSFAHEHSGEAGCAKIFPANRFELDVRNDGNRFADLIAPLMRRVARLSQFLDRAATGNFGDSRP